MTVAVRTVGDRRYAGLGHEHDRRYAGIAHTHPSTDTTYYRYSANTTITDPGTGNFRTNGVGVVTGSFVGATALAIDDVSDRGVDWTNVLGSLVAGDTVYIQVADDATVWVRYEITGAPPDRVGWFEFPVTSVTQSGTSPSPNTECLVQFTRSTGGGGGAPVDAYTKAESDARFEPIDTMYTKAESDARYALASALTALTARVTTLEAQVATLQTQMTGHQHASGTIDQMGGAVVLP